MVLATNRPGDLDGAISDRIDESMFFDTPDRVERQRLVVQYHRQHLLARSTLAAQVSSVSSPAFKQLAELDGSSLIGEPADSKQLPKWLARELQGSRGLSLCSRGSQPPRIELQGITVAFLKQIAEQTDGFSGRQLSKLMLNLQGAAYSDERCFLTVADAMSVLNAELHRHRVRVAGVASRKKRPVDLDASSTESEASHHPQNRWT